MGSDESLAELDRRLLAAHAAHDRAALARLYRLAAERAAGTGDVAAACFYRTHAYVWALETGDPDAPGDRAFLKSHGREH